MVKKWHSRWRIEYSGAVKPKKKDDRTYGNNESLGEKTFQKN